ncbi:MAG: hypothetical protein K2G53_06915 [Muribaculaceae bacterium]|nr:hypothetical protein [Bacteroides sp.]MDE6072268.1 hypothetical protein [Muribaculaceae bacterium]
MKTVKQIERPQFTAARKLTPLEMNGIRVLRQHTVLTPRLLHSIVRRGSEGK